MSKDNHRESDLYEVLRVEISLCCHSSVPDLRTRKPDRLVYLLLKMLLRILNRIAMQSISLMCFYPLVVLHDVIPYPLRHHAIKQFICPWFSSGRKILAYCYFVEVAANKKVSHNAQ